MKKILLAVLLAILATSAYAGKTYTQSQLNHMVNSGHYPDQGSVINTQTKSISYSACKVEVENVMSQLRGSYPVKIIVNTNILYTVKAWTNDGAITVSCSGPDHKMVITQATYR